METVPHDWHVWQWKRWLIARLFPPVPLENPVWVRGGPNRLRGEILPSILDPADPNCVPKGQMFDISGVMGIPPKVEYGREKDPIIRDDRQADSGGDS